MGKGNGAMGARQVSERRKQMKAGREKRSHMAAGKKECCILCGKLTEVLQGCPVSEREYYLEGAGQLCRECYRKIYTPSHNENVVQLEAVMGRNHMRHGGKQWKA